MISLQKLHIDTAHTYDSILLQVQKFTVYLLLKDKCYQITLRMHTWLFPSTNLKIYCLFPSRRYKLPNFTAHAHMTISFYKFKNTLGTNTVYYLYAAKYTPIYFCVPFHTYIQSTLAPINVHNSLVSVHQAPSRGQVLRVECPRGSRWAWSWGGTTIGFQCGCRLPAVRRRRQLPHSQVCVCFYRAWVSLYIVAARAALHCCSSCSFTLLQLVQLYIVAARTA